MKHRLPLILLAAAVIALSSARAQSDDDDDDQEFDYFSYFSRAHSNLTFGFRATQGAKVSFGNLGAIPATTPAAAFTNDPATNNVTRTYNNGFVGADALRPEEINPPAGTVQSYVDANGISRYRTIGKEFDGQGFPAFDTHGDQITYTSGDFVAYQPNLTRSYGFANASQVANGALTLSQYSTLSSGGAFAGKKSLSGGLDMQVERLFSNPSKRFRFSLVAGVSLNGINSKRTGTVNSTLHIITDTYTLNGALPATAVFPYQAPDLQAGTFNDSVGIPINIGNAVESSPGVVQTGGGTLPGPTRVETDVVDGAEVTGVWEIKGSYLVVRFGPEFTASMTPSISVSGSAGFAAAYVGTNYTAMETATILNDPTLIVNTITTGALVSETSKFMPGYYANFDAAWAVNERTGFFAGLTYESFGTFDQTLEGRTAKIDLGGNASLRGGLNIKF